jgi:hypothetical protein
MEKYYSVELSQQEALLFKAFLLGMSVRFEASGCYGLTHFEVLFENGVDFEKASLFLEEL